MCCSAITEYTRSYRAPHSAPSRSGDETTKRTSPRALFSRACGRPPRGGLCLGEGIDRLLEKIVAFALASLRAGALMKILKR